MHQPNLFDGMVDPPIVVARRRGHQAAEAAAAHADDVHAEWTQQAAIYIEQYAHRRHRLDEWLLEDARQWAHDEGLPQPPEPRAWGAVVQRLKRHGVIEACGYAPAVSSNGSAKVRWRLKR